MTGIIPKKYNIFGCPSPHNPNECFKISTILLNLQQRYENFLKKTN
jgi:hypothetical protein